MTGFCKSKEGIVYKYKKYVGKWSEYEYQLENDEYNVYYSAGFNETFIIIDELEYNSKKYNI